MRIISYSADGVPSLGVLMDDEHFAAVHELDAGLPRTLDALLERSDGLERLRTVTKGAAGNHRLAAVTLGTLLQQPHAFWALALNFKTHIQETGLTTSVEHPQIFLRVPASFVPPGAPLLAPPPEIARAFDYEGELGVVIGRGGRHIPLERALEHVAGYCAVNEGSVREFQRHNRQFGLGKNFEQSGSYGPWLMTADEFGNPATHSLITRLNGVVRQHAPLDDMLFSVEAVIHYLSVGYTLRPGDVIAMGTSGALPPAAGDVAGNDLSLQVGDGPGKKIPGRVHMRAGDVVEVEITGLGVLRNPIAADLPAAYRSPAAGAELAPHGVLRAAINFGNTVLAHRAPKLEDSGGVSVAIARELARRLNVPLELVPFDGAGAVVAVAKDDVFDVAFMAIDPLRAAELGFTAPYVLIEGGYLVRNESPLKSAAEVDRPGTRMTVGDRSAYDLYLTRTLQHAEITREPTSVEALDLFMRGGFDVAAGVKASLADYAATHPGVRLLDGRFMVIEQAMVTVHGPHAVRTISALIEELKASGFVAEELSKSGQSDAVVAPPA